MMRRSEPRRAARRVGMSIAFVVVVVSAVYVVVDLARWEWNRAALAALVCVAALVVFSTTVLVGHLTRLEHRLDDVDRRLAPDRAATGREARSTPVARPRFAWLDDTRDRGVFVPILLGAGAILSFLASVVERISGAVAHPNLGPGELERLGVVLVHGEGSSAVERRRRRGRMRRVIVGLVALALAAGAVEALRQLTQSRPGDVTARGSTVVEVLVEQRRLAQDPELLVVELWGACRSRLGTGVAPTSVVGLGGGAVRLELDRALGTTGRRRLVGCFQDHTLDLVRADVIAVDVRVEDGPATP